MALRWSLSSPAGGLVRAQPEHLVRGLLMVSPPQPYKLSGSPMLR